MDRISRIKTVVVGGIVTVGALCVAACGMLTQGQAGPPQNDMTVDKIARNEVLEAVIAMLNRAYVFPDMAAQLDRQLHAQMRQGKFDAVTSAEKLAATLTDILQRTSHDQHLEVRYVEKVVPEPALSGEQSADDAAAELLDGQRFNFGFAAVDRLKGDIGYIDLHQFSRPQHTARRIAAAMVLMADTRALIVDLRKCGGGDPETVILFASYLFDAPTHLNDIYWRDENRTEMRWTTDTVAGPRYGERREVYLLTSRDTFSGCEDFAYALKNAGRATLVGEVTGGGAHAGSPQRLAEHFVMFVPSGRPINPITHTDWEGVGVLPDIKVSAKNALAVAQGAALKSLIAGETDADWRQRMQKTLSELD